MIVVDTSVWIAAFKSGRGGRGGDRITAEAKRLSVLLDESAVAIVAPVRIELLNGTPRRELNAMRRWLSALPLLVPSDSTWKLSEHWALEAASAGERFGVIDLIIAAAAAEHDASVWSLDADFARMNRLGFVSLYAIPTG